MAHDEFPELMPQSRAALQAAEISYQQGIANLGGFCRERMAKAAFLREALEQVSPGRDFLAGSTAHQLNCIANNLHALPPPPPTREELDQALLELEAWERFSEIRTTEWFKERFAVLQRGIAHHCKVQP